MRARVAWIVLLILDLVTTACSGAGIGWYGSVEDAAASMTSVAATFQPEDRARASYEQLFIEVYRPLFLAIQPRLRRLARLRERLVEGGRR